MKDGVLEQISTEWFGMQFMRVAVYYDNSDITFSFDHQIHH